jgi:transcriptional regulator with XRE-family HTH domain
MIRFGTEVHKARKDRGLTLEKLAKRTQTHKGYISGIENDKVSPPSPRMVKRLAKALDLDADRLLALSFIEKRPAALALRDLRKTIDELMSIEETAILDAHDAAHRGQQREAV